MTPSLQQFQDRKAVALYLAALLLLGFAFTPAASATSQHECEIWLCLPGGFGPSQCSAAHHAMIKRISPPHPKPALPPFGECSKDNDDKDMSYQRGLATYVPEQKVCGHYSNTGGRYGERRRCLSYHTIKAHWEKGKYCAGGHLSDRRAFIGGRYRQHHSNVRCTKQKSFITIFQRGEQLGNTYYW